MTNSQSIDELRRCADNGDAEACNRFGMILLEEAPGDSDEFIQISTDRLSEDELDSRIAQVDGWASGAYDVAHNVDLAREWEVELGELLSEKRSRQLGFETVAAERRQSRRRALEQAFRYFETSAALGDPEGMWNCGWRFLLGEGVEQNDRIAKLYWAHASAVGHAQAMCKLEEMSAK